MCYANSACAVWLKAVINVIEMKKMYPGTGNAIS